ncbi:dsDNA nuclease domain-containing protein [Acinetobacter sp. TSRC1-2]|uniref:dsDNA nuclease domain-containing protein n=1 Tax=unclassified Acinetobacter TaxID=196816 RepID=UPI003CE88989
MLDGSKAKEQNPLAVVQRETAGASTYGKYEYQYHWALSRILDEHAISTDYVVFVELHEDVIYCSSTDSNKAQFEFNQVKNKSSSKYTSKSLTKSTKKDPNSVLGKMLLGVQDKPYIDKLVSLNLVATCSFSLQLNGEPLNLEVIKVGDLHDDCINEIQAAIKKEIGEENLPNTLSFITPTLPPTGFQRYTIGQVSNLVNKIKAGANHNAESIYRLLVDELRIKGAVTYDYKLWEDLINRKGLTGHTVENTISQFTETHDLQIRENELTEILHELNTKYHEKTKIKKAFHRYHTSSLQRNLAILQDKEILKEVVTNNYSVYENEGLEHFIKISMDQLLKNDKITSKDIYDLKARLLYELICKNEEY